MNILYRACASKKGYQSRVLKELYKRGVFDRCTVVTQPLDGKDHYPEEIYREIPAYIGYEAKYNSICDMEMLPEVPEKIMRSMLEYESVALNMASRNYLTHIMYYDEMYKEYMMHMKFWNWILDTEKIEFVFLITVPHYMWEYVLYALAKVKNIPVLLELDIAIQGLNQVGTSIESLGQNVKKYYDSNPKCEMEENIKKYYKGILEKKSSGGMNNSRNVLVEKRKWEAERSYKPLVRRIFNNKLLLTDIIEKRTKSKFRKDVKACMKDIKMLYRIIGEQTNVRKIDYYNKNIAEAVNYKKKYIFYTLQYDPECGILPMGGVFWNQLSAIKMLAKSAQKHGVAVYVKEHWIQWGRKKAFYEELRSIPNVYLVSSTEDTYKLIGGAVAVSSLAGTCLQEGIVKGIPALTFANHFMSGAPGVYRVGSEEEVNNALKLILSDNYSINPKEVENYFAAFSNTLVRGYLSWPRNPVYKLSDCIADTVNLIEKFVEAGMPEDFYFVKEQ